MAKGIRINFLADVRDFLRGTKDLEKELDDVADSLDEMAKDGDKATEKLERSFKDLARETRKAGDDVGDGMGRGFKRMEALGEDAATEIKDEFKSNLSEVTSSFDGSVESMGDLVQGTLGGLVPALGPLGLAVGAAGAAGVGLVIKSFQDAEARAEEFRAKVSELTQALIEAGDDGSLSAQFISDKLKELATVADEGATSLKDIKDIADDTGTSFDKLARMYAGNVDGIDELIESQSELNDEYDRGMSRADALRGKVDDENSSRERLVQQLTDQKKAIEDAAEAERLYLEAGGAEYEAKAGLISQVNAAYDAAVNSVDDFINKETGLFDITAYAASIEERKRLLVEYQSNLATSGLTTEQISALNEMGVEQAAAILNGLKDPNVSDETKRTVMDSLSDSAKEGSGVAKDIIEEKFAKPTKAELEVEAKTEKAQEAFSKFIRGLQKEVFITATVVDREGRPVR